MSSGGQASDAALWGVCVHEAGHVVIARRLGAHRVTAKINKDGCGSFEAWFDGTKIEEAVILLAGAEAAVRMTGLPHDRGSDDMSQVRRLLRGSGTSIGQARKTARRLVHCNRRQIEKVARQFHRKLLAGL